ncbi:MAG TPA: DNA methyltransferase [Planctomycetota bacterium]|nr:DNA methyltransferase [Planctomycetota bacterium]
MARRSPTSAGNVLYYGDNLDILRRHVTDESVDLVYLDPPFNSNQDYNVLFEEQDGAEAAAQIKVFEDTWRWDQGAARAYEEVVESAEEHVANAMRAFRTLLGDSNMMAYLAMMAPRLVELHRVLKPTGSIYLHCDPTASHYLKVLMDGVFGPQNCRREVIWRSGWVSGFKAAAKNWVRNHDVLLYYVKDRGEEYTFNKDLAYKPHEEGYERRGGGENPKGVAIDDVWDEVELYSPWIKSFSTEKLGYKTQKPVTLLERVISVSSNEGDVVLDPFCGCGTTIHAAQVLKRRWIGIDVTALAIALIKNRLQHGTGAEAGKDYRVIGEPTTLADASVVAEDDPYQFQWWALGLLGARPANPQKGADKGIDGRLFFHDDPKPGGETKQFIISVKAGGVTVSHVRDLRGVMEREQAEMGALISLEEPTGPMRKEAASAGFYTSPWDKKMRPRIQLLTVGEILAGKGLDYAASAPVQGGNVTLAKPAKGKGKRSDGSGKLF